MTVLLTSFQHWFSSGDTYMHVFDRAYSIAVYQPSWFSPLPKLETFDIRREGGAWVRPRDFLKTSQVLVDRSEKPDMELLQRYHDTLLGMYKKRMDDYGTSLAGPVWTEKNIVMCCWCPYDKAAQRQLKDYGSFVCHSWAVETFLKEYGVEVVRDKDREKMVR